MLDHTVVFLLTRNHHPYKYFSIVFTCFALFLIMSMLMSIIIRADIDKNESFRLQNIGIPGGGLSIFTYRDQRSIFWVLNFQNLHFFWVLTAATVFFYVTE